jgi:hypothetical protein
MGGSNLDQNHPFLLQFTTLLYFLDLAKGKNRTDDGMDFIGN